MSELEFSRIIGMVLMEQAHSLKESWSSDKDYEDSTTHFICELSLSLTTVSIMVRLLIPPMESSMYM